MLLFLQSRLREMVEYDDLSEEQVTDLPSLKIADSTKFSQGLLPVVNKVVKHVLVPWGKHLSISESNIAFNLECNHQQSGEII